MTRRVSARITFGNPTRFPARRTRCTTNLIQLR
jgi:hypothetical protein